MLSKGILFTGIALLSGWSGPSLAGLTDKETYEVLKKVKDLIPEKTDFNLFENKSSIKKELTTRISDLITKAFTISRLRQGLSILSQDFSTLSLKEKSQDDFSLSKGKQSIQAVQKLSIDPSVGPWMFRNYPLFQKMVGLPECPHISSTLETFKMTSDKCLGDLWTPMIKDFLKAPPLDILHKKTEEALHHFVQGARYLHICRRLGPENKELIEDITKLTAGMYDEARERREKTEQALANLIFLRKNIGALLHKDPTLVTKKLEPDLQKIIKYNFINLEESEGQEDQSGHLDLLCSLEKERQALKLYKSYQSQLKNNLLFYQNVHFYLDKWFPK